MCASNVLRFFDSDRGLHEFFGKQRLYTWEENLPLAFTKGQRINLTLQYLQDKENPGVEERC